MNYADNNSFFNDKSSPEERTSADGLLAAPGMSNTRCECPSSQSLNVFIDYLYVRFHGGFSPFNEEDLQRFAPLFGLLKIYPQFYTEQKSRSWKNFLQYDTGTFFKSSTDYNESKDGPCCYLELKGEGCRSFELRGGSWPDLLSWILDHTNHVNRIDVALDDMAGIITMNQILDRIHKGAYSTRLRTWKVVNGSNVFDEVPNIVQSKNDGCSITFGGRQTKQLQIYNKAAERMAKNYSVEHGSWIRYEGRFMHEVGYDVLNQVVAGFYTSNILSVIAGLIKGLVEFKEHSADSRVRRRENWHLWEKLLLSAEKIVPQKQSSVESNLAKKQSWLSIASGRILAKAYLANPDEFDNYIGFSVANKIEEFNFVDLAEVNNLRIIQNMPIYETLEDARVILQKRFQAYAYPTDYLKSVLKKETMKEYLDQEEFGDDYD